MNTKCNWSQGGEDSDVWQTQCGHYMAIIEGTPAENEFAHCCFCGKSLVGHIHSRQTTRTAPMPAKRSPWFNARTQPPVNGDRHALYERRCPLGNIAQEVELVGKTRLIDSACDRCQWRGLLREDGGKA